MKVGVKLSTLEVTGGSHKVTYAGTRDLALQGEEAGFDSVWLADHLLFREGGSIQGVWECWTFLSGLAEATRRVELGTLVLCTQFRNPALIAKMATTLDEVSGGRLVLGLGAGWVRDGFNAFGFPFDHRVERFDEALQVITSLLRRHQPGVYRDGARYV